MDADTVFEESARESAGIGLIGQDKPDPPSPEGYGGTSRKVRGGEVAEREEETPAWLNGDVDEYLKSWDEIFKHQDEQDPASSEPSVYAQRAAERTAKMESESFRPTKRTWGLVRSAFKGEDPLSFVEDANVRDNIRFWTKLTKNPEEEQQSWALAAYYSQVYRKDIRFCRQNLQALNEKWFEKEGISVGEAYEEMKKFYRGEIDWSGSLGAMWEDTQAMAKAMTGKVMKTMTDIFYTGVQAAMTDPEGDAMRTLLLSDKEKEAYYAGVRGVQEGISNLHKYTRDLYGEMAEENSAKVLPEDWVYHWDGGMWLANLDRFLLMEAPSQAVQIYAAYTMGPLGFTLAMGGSSGLEKYYDLADSGLSEEQKVKNAMLTGLINSGAAWVTAGIVKGKIPGLNKEALLKGNREIVSYFVKAFGIEAGQEALEQLAENATDIYTGVYGDPEQMSSQEFYKHLWNGVPESALAGDAFGLGAGAAGYRSAREFAGVVEFVDRKANGTVTELEKKETLTEKEKKQLERAKLIAECDDPGKKILLHQFAERAFAAEEVEEVEEIRESEEFKRIMETADEGTTEEMVIQSILAEREKQIRDMVPWTEEDVSKAVWDFATGIPGTKFVVFDGVDILPEAVKADMRRRGYRDPRAFVYQGEVYLNAKRVRPSEVFGTLTHEVVGHKGLRALFGEQKLNELLDAVYREHYQDEAFQQVAMTYKLGKHIGDAGSGDAEGFRRSSDARSAMEDMSSSAKAMEDMEEDEYALPPKLWYSVDDVVNQRIAAEEYLAHLAESMRTKPGKAKPSWWREFLQKIRMALGRVFGKPVTMTDREIETLLARSARAMRKRMLNRRSRVYNDAGEVRYSLDEDVLNSPVPEIVIDFPSVDITNAEAVRSVLEKYIGTSLRINSDGRIASFSKENNRASLKRHNENRIAAESLDKVIESAYPVGWIIGDATKKHARILGQYIYASSFSVKDKEGNRSTYFARIALDGTGTENEGVFKDISIKKAEEGTYVGSDLQGDPYRRTSSAPITIRQLIEKVKEHYKQNHKKYFLEDIPESIELQRDLLYERAVDENQEYAKGMLKRAADRNGYRGQDSLEITYDEDGQLIPLSKRFSKIGQDRPDRPDRPDGGVRYSVAPVWTGSAADYEKPSLHYVGTGEGAQVYGWGLYGSSEREVGEWYAEKDVDHKKTADVLWDEKPSDDFFRKMREKSGKTDDYWHLSALHDMLKDKRGDIDRVKEIILHDIELKKKYNQPKEDIEGLRWRLQLLEEYRDRVKYRPAAQKSLTINGEKFVLGQGYPGKADWENVLFSFLFSAEGDRQKALRNVDEAIKITEYRLQDADKADPYYQDRLSDLKNVREFLSDKSNKIGYDDGTTGRRNLYKQTFWPGKKENLLDWDKSVGEEQAEKILDELAAEGSKEAVSFVNREREDWQEDPDTGEIEAEPESYPEDVLREYLEQYLDFYEANGEDVYQQLTDVLGSPKAASEFLYRAGIDGITYIGDDSGVRNYVAFSDQDIQVDEHIRYMLSEYSEADIRDIVAILRPFAGTSVYKNPKDYAKYLAEHGVKDIPEKDAFGFADLAARENNREAQKRAAKERDQWIYENNPMWQMCVDFCGGTEFKIKPAFRFQGEDFSGTWISADFVKYSEKRPQGKKESDASYVKYLKRREAALRKADGMASDQLAEAIARKTGRDALEVEQEIIDYFRDLKKPDLYHEYHEWKEKQAAGSKAQHQRMFDEYMRQEQARIEDEVVEVLQRGQPIDLEWIDENRDVYKELYRQLFPDKEKAPFAPGKADLEAINAALTQEGSNAADYAKAYKEARKKAFGEYMEALRKLRDKVMQSNADALKLQREALDFAEKYLRPEERWEFARDIVRLLEYSTEKKGKYLEGRRMFEFQKLLKRMTERANAIRKKELVSKIAKRLGEVGEKAGNSRKVRGVRDPETQQKLNRIIAISRMDGGTLNMEITARQKEIEDRLADGESTADQEYDIALLNCYGELWNKSADEVQEALNQLNRLARDGRDDLLRAIQERQAEDEQDRNELWDGINGMKRLSSVEKKTLRDRRERRWKALKKLDTEFWSNLSLDGIFRACAYFSGDEASILDRFAVMAHRAKVEKDTMNFRNTEDVRKKLNAIFGVKTAIGRAKKLGEWRKIEEKSGVFRFVPDPDAKQFEYRRISVADAREMLQAYDAGNGVLADYEAEAIRQQLRTLDLGIKYDSVPEEFRDGATEKLLKLIRQEGEAGEEPQVVIPRQTFNGSTREIPLTQLQGLYLKLLWEQKDIRYKMHYNGYTEETMRQLDKFLRPEVKDFGVWMRGELEKDRAKISEVYRKMYYAMFPAEENYFPSCYDVSRAGMRKGAVDIAEEGAGAGAHVYTPGSLKVRVYHLKDVRVADALTVFQNHRLLMNHFVTHAEAARKMRAVLLNPYVKGAIEAEHGTDCFREMQNGLTDFINGGNADVAVNGIAAELYANAVRTKMAFNVFSGVKQTLGFLTYIQEIPAHKLLTGMRYAIAHPKEVYRTLGSTDYYRARLESGANADLRLLLDASGKKASGFAELFGQIDRTGSFSMRYGDAASVLFGGFAVYKYHFDNLVKRGMSEADARREALTRWEMATERTQQSSNPFFLNRHQRGGYAERLFTTFLSNQILLWNHNAGNVYKAIHYRDKKALRKAGSGLAALVLSSFASTAIDQLRLHYSDDDYEWLDLIWNLIADSLCGTGPAGSAAAEAVNALKPGGFISPKLYLGDILYAGYAIKRQFFSSSDAEWSDNACRDAVNILVAMGYLWQPLATTASIAKEGRKWYQIFNKDEAKGKKGKRKYFEEDWK